MRKSSLLLAVGLVSLSLGVTAATPLVVADFQPQLLADLDDDNGGADWSTSYGFTTSGDNAFFADDASGGVLYRYDASHNYNIITGAYVTPTDSLNIGAVPCTNGDTLFSGRAGPGLTAYDVELVVVHPNTSAEQLVDLSTGGSSYPHHLTAFGGRVLFAAGTDNNSNVPHISDCTAVGTTPLTASDGSSLYSATFFTELKTAGIALFAASSAAAEDRLWVTNGSSAGTHFVDLVSSKGDQAFPVDQPASNGTLALVPTVNANEDTFDIFRTDGTASGTAILASNVAEGALVVSSTQSMMYFGYASLAHQSTIGRVFPSGTVQTMSWPTDQKVADLQPAANGAAIVGVMKSDLTGYVGSFYSDGTAAGTFQISDDPFLYGSAPVPGTGWTVVMTGSLNGPYSSLWITDGTAAGTVKLATCPIANSADRPVFAFAGKRLVFRWGDTTYGSEPFFIDLSALPERAASTPQESGESKDGGGGSWNLLGSALLALAALVRRAKALVKTKFAGVTGGAFALLVAVPAGAALISVLTASLLFDLNTDKSRGAEPAQFVALGDGTRATFFTQDDYSSWVTDGTETGTVKLPEIVPNQLFMAFIGPAYNGKIYGYAFDNDSKLHLAVTDGTVAGTRELNIGAGSLNSLPFQSGAYAYFGASVSPGAGPSLWRTDSTQAGTTVVKEFSGAGEGLASNTFAALSSGKILFTATTAAAGDELWTSDGTAAGTVLVKDIFPGTSSSSPANFVSGGNVVYFMARGGTADGYEFWQTDGTNAGTVRVADLCAGTCSASLNAGSMIGSTFVFTAQNGTSRRLYAYKPGVGVTELSDLAQSPEYPYSVSLIGQANGRSFYAASYNSKPPQLLSTDGTVAGTTFLANLMAKNGVTIGNQLYFIGTAVGGKGNVWVSDGTSASQVTSLAKDVTAIGTDGSRLLVSADDGVHPIGSELYLLSGASLSLVKDLNQWSDGSNVKVLPVAGKAPLFIATSNSQTADSEIFTLDAAGSKLSRGVIADGVNVEMNDGVVSAGGKSFFIGIARGGVDPDYALWATDGTNAGTKSLLVIDSDYVGGSDKMLAASGGLAYTVTKDSGGDYAELYRSDGTGAGTFKLYADTNYNSCDAPRPVVMGSTVYFVGSDDVNGSQIWSTDGTVAGTHLAFELPGSFVCPGALVVSAGKLYFSAYDDSTNSGALLVSDGTTAGTHEIKFPGGGPIEVDELHATPTGVVGTESSSGVSQAFFVSGASATASVLHFDDAGTFPVEAIRVVNGIVFLQINRPDNDRQNIYFSNGTLAGTYVISETGTALPYGTAVDAETTFIEELGLSDGVRAVLMLQEASPHNAVRIVQTDGTPSGTALVAQIDGYDVGGAASGMAEFDNKIYFAGYDDEHGVEPWVITATSPSAGGGGGGGLAPLSLLMMALGAAARRRRRGAH